jgi:serine/threonine protein phosphatase PrpC
MFGFRRTKTKKALPTLSSSSVASGDTGAHALKDSDLVETLSATRPLTRAMREHGKRVQFRFAASFEQGLRDGMEDTGVLLWADEPSSAAGDGDDNDVVVDAVPRVVAPRSQSQHVRHATVPSKRVLCAFGVFDGHGGPEMSARLRLSLADDVVAAVDALSAEDFANDQRCADAVADAFVAFDRRFRDEVMGATPAPLQTAGSTALLVIVLAHSLEMLVCNVGDTRAVLRRDSGVVPLSRDHLPTLASERHRVQASENGFLREGLVNGVLQMTRAFGDFELKGSAPPERAGVIAKPEIRRVQLCEADTHIVVACDGLWDVLTSYDVVKIINEHHDPSEIDDLCGGLVRTALERGSTDNTSCFVLHIHVASDDNGGDGDDDDKPKIVKRLSKLKQLLVPKK